MSRTAKPNRRSWVSINLMTVMIGLVITGLLSFSLSYSQTISGIHTWFGFAFIVLIGFHFKNNLKTLFNYIKQVRGKRYTAISLFVSLLICIGVLLSLPVFDDTLEFGRNLRKSVALNEETFQTITTVSPADGTSISVELRKGPHYESPPQPLFLGLTYTSIPQVAFWLENEDGSYIDTIYVTQKSSNNSFIPTDDMMATVARPEALPYWAHKRGINHSENSTSTMLDNADLDGISGATPVGHYEIQSRIKNGLKKFRVLMEINRSYDFNNYYSKDRFPEDKVYSGSGSSGQPSVIYAVDIDLSNNLHHYLMQPIGRGHHSGADGSLYPDMSNMDTALQLVKRVMVDI